MKLAATPPQKRQGQAASDWLIAPAPLVSRLFGCNSGKVASDWLI